MLTAACALLMLVGATGAGALEPATAQLVVMVSSDTDGGAELGREYTYTFTVRNTGDVAVSEITVDDTFVGHVGDIPMLAPGETVEISKRITMADPGSGACTARGLDPEGGQVSGGTSHAVEIYIADNFTDLSVSKRLVSGSATPGGTLRYRIVVSNMGADPVDVDAPTFELVDDFDEAKVKVLDAGGGTISSGRLLWTTAVPGPGETRAFEYSLRVLDRATGVISNTATIDYPLDLEDANNRATVRTTVIQETSTGSGTGSSAGSSSTTVVRAAQSGTGSDEPFLPFTGTDTSRSLELALGFVIFGLALRVAALQGSLT